VIASHRTDVWTNVCVDRGYAVDSAVLSPSRVGCVARVGDDGVVFPAAPTASPTRSAQGEWAEDLHR
jgi:hypothetical protein